MVEHYSHRIQNVIQKELFKAQKSIKIAVAWFTNDLLFQPLLLKLQAGVSVELILNKDEINDSGDNEIDFNSFTEAGGILHWNASKTLMHEKFCIIDDSTIIYGSYNWTNKAEYNDESVAVSKDEEGTVSFYTALFNKLCKAYPAEDSINPVAITRFNPFDLSKGEIVFDLFGVLVYRWIIKEKYVYRIFSKETRKQICLYDFEDILIHSDPSVSSIGVKRFGMWYFYSLKGKNIGIIQYNLIQAFPNENAFWIWQKGLLGIANDEGVEELACIYESITSYYSRKCVVYRKDTTYGIIYQGHDIFGGWFFEEIEIINTRFFIIKLDGKYALCEFNNAILDDADYCPFITDPEYDKIESIKDDYFIVTKDNKKGVFHLAKNGIECSCDDISYIGKNRFIARKNKKEGLYEDGKLIIPCIYDKLIPDGMSTSFFKKKAGVISENGETIVDFKYSNIKYYRFYDEPYDKDGFFLVYNKPYFGIWIDKREIGYVNETPYSIQNYIADFSLFEYNEDVLLEEMRNAIVRSIFLEIMYPSKFQEVVMCTSGFQHPPKEEPELRIVRIANENKFLNSRYNSIVRFTYTELLNYRKHVEVFCLDDIRKDIDDCKKRRFSEGDILEISKNAPVILDKYGTKERRYILVKVYSPATGTSYYTQFSPQDFRTPVFPIDDNKKRLPIMYPNGSAAELYIKGEKDTDIVFDLLTRNRRKDCKIRISKIIQTNIWDRFDNDQALAYVYTYDLET